MSQAITWAVGQTLLDDYVIERELGRGGMGCVWLVKSKSTGRRFAVKQTLLKDAEHRKAFLTELQTWIDLPEHPNIVPCRFFRTVGDEIVIFADYIAGGSLAEWIARRKLTKLEQILDVAIQFAWGLHAVHERGLIHQDVKPGNVLMTPDGVPMITDFGLARARLRASDGRFVSPVANQGRESVLISAGGMTPAYASPEQVAGQPLSRKTDIWSWGISVLDMFMGGVSCPHGGHSAAEVLTDFLEHGQMETDLPEMPGVFAGILAQCFVRDPAARVMKLDMIANTLIEYIEYCSGQKYGRTPPHVAGPVTQDFQHDRSYSGTRWRKPNEWLREAYIVFGRDPKEADDFQPVVVCSRKASGIGELAIYEEAQRVFDCVIQNGHPEYRERMAALFFDKALIQASIDDVPGAIQSFDQCIAILEQLVMQEEGRELANNLATAYNNKAVVLKALGDLRESVAVFDRSISIYECLVEQEGRRELANDLAMVYMDKAIATRGLGDLHGAVTQYDRCIAILRRLVEQEGRRELADDLAMAYMNKAIAIQLLGDLRGAVELFDQCIAIYEQLVMREGRRDLAHDLARAYVNKANTVRTFGDLREVVALNDRSIEIYVRLIEQEGRNELTNELAVSYMVKAIATGALGDLCGAVAVYDRCIAIWEHLVAREGRRELTGQWAWAKLHRVWLLRSLGNLSVVEIANAKKTFALLEEEVTRTGLSDLQDVLQWAQENLAEVL